METRRFRTSPDGMVRIERWTANEKRFSTQAATSVTLALRLLNYPGWRVQVDGVSAQAGADPETAQVLIALPAGAHRVEVQFSSTWDRIAGAMISAIFALLLVTYIFFTCARRKS